MCSLARKAPPLTVICVSGGPEAVSRLRNALVGVGVGHGELAEQSAWATAREAGETIRSKADDATAPSRMAAGRSRLDSSERMKPGNDNRGGSVTPAARGQTTPSSARGIASAGRGRRAAAA